MRKTSLFLITLMIIFLSAAVATAGDKLVSYTNDEYHFAMKYPEREWSEVNPPYGNSIWEISNDNDSVLYINAIDYDEKETSIWQVNMKAFAKGFMKGMRKNLPDSELINVEKSYINGVPAFLITYKYRYINSRETLVFYGTQYACIQDKKLYVITYESLENTGEETKNQLQAAVKSFAFTDR